MSELKELSEKEIARRKKLAERRKKGYEKYIRKKKKEREAKKRKDVLRKQKERAKKALRALKGKRKVGRPKKRGRPKLRKKRANIIEAKPIRVYPQYRYKIISCRNGRQNKFIGKYYTSEMAYEAFNKLQNDNNVIFQSMTTGQNTIKNSIDEYILIEKNDGEEIELRNEYGKFVKQKLNKEGWIIIDKFRYKKEEDFWVWGYNNKTDRKTFAWIYVNLLMQNIDTRFDFKRVLIYKNKIIFKDDNGNIDLIFCKSESDAIRFYNLLERWVIDDKIKQILFIGNFSALSPKRKALEEELVALTGWSKKKIQMKNTTYYCKKH